jgi:hypothetical protein
VAAPVNRGYASARPAPTGGPEKVNILLVDDQPARLMTYQSVLARA